MTTTKELQESPINANPITPTQYPILTLCASAASVSACARRMAARSSRARVRAFIPANLHSTPKTPNEFQYHHLSRSTV